MHRALFFLCVSAELWEIFISSWCEISNKILKYFMIRHTFICHSRSFSTHFAMHNGCKRLSGQQKSLVALHYFCQHITRAMMIAKSFIHFDILIKFFFCSHALLCKFTASNLRFTLHEQLSKCVMEKCSL